MQLSKKAGEVLATYALGSCLGISIHDTQACVGGILHVMLPSISGCPEPRVENPWKFVDSGLPLFFKKAYAVGAEKKRLSIKVVGGASGDPNRDFFAIGKRNLLALRKLFFQNGIFIDAQDTGGSISRSLYLEVGTGRTWVHSNGQKREI